MNSKSVFFMIGVLFLVVTACTGKSGGTVVYGGKESQYSKFINNKNQPKNPNLTVDKSIINQDYPFEIALYQDHQFFYDLPNLGSGTGTWKYSDGKIELRAKLPIFDMYVEIYGADEGLTTAAIQFRDRHGANTLKMENNNF